MTIEAGPWRFSLSTSLKAEEVRGHQASTLPSPVPLQTDAVRRLKCGSVLFSHLICLFIQVCLQINSLPLDGCLTHSERCTNPWVIWLVFLCRLQCADFPRSRHPRRLFEAPADKHMSRGRYSRDADISNSSRLILLLLR